MLTRQAKAVWEGNLANGTGNFEVGSGKVSGSYSVPTRFGEEKGTNPEELIGAAHAACYSMALSGKLTAAGFPPTRIETSAHVHMEKLEAGWRIVKIDLATSAQVPNIDNDTFQNLAEQTKDTCPISAALSPTIALKAQLV